MAAAGGSNNDNSNNENGVILIMNPAHLSDGEIEYEIDIRKDLGDLPFDHVYGPIGKLQARLQMDASQGRSPTDRTITLTDEQRATELEVCENELTKLSKEASEWLTGPVERPESLYKIASRLTHYDNRLNRISLENADQDQKEQAGRAKVLVEGASRCTERGLRLVPPQPQLNVSAHSTTPSQQGPLNSTLNGEVVDLAAEDTPNVSIQTVRAVQEMREEYACRARDNSERLELTLRQANRLHKDLLDGYLKGGSGGSIERLPRMLDETKTEYAHIQRLMAGMPTASMELRTRVGDILARMAGDIEIMQARIVKARYESARVNAIHSTLRPQDRTMYPTMPLFPDEMETTSLNESRTADKQPPKGQTVTQVGSNGQPLSRNAETATNHVTFVTEPQVIQDTTPVNSGTQSRWNEAPRMNDPPPASDLIDDENGIRYRSESRPKEYNDSTGSRQWPWPTSDTRAEHYHPATTPVQIPDYGLNANRMPRRIIPSESNGQSQPMNLWQSQQFFGRILGSRRYDGKSADGTKTISTDEFIGHIRQYQRSTRTVDSAVLDMLSTYVTGEAFTWWKTNALEIHTIDQLEIRLKARFDQTPMDYMSQMTDFATRKQGVDEKLCTYVDDMRQKAFNIRPALEESTIINKIVDNANEIYKPVLASRAYESLAILNRHAEYLSQLTPQKAITNKPVQKPFKSFRPKSMQAVEVTKEEDDVAMGWTDNETVEEEEATAVIIGAIERAVKTLSARQTQSVGQRGNGAQKAIKVTEAMNVEASIQPHATSSQCCSCEVQANERGCFGCGAPGVFKRNCVTCNNRPPKNDRAAQ